MSYPLMPDGQVVPFSTNEPPRLAVDTPTISAAAGGTMTFNLDAHWAHAGREHVLVTGVTGTSPGIPLLGSAVLPINVDAVTFLVFSLTFQASPFSSFYGILDADGEASPKLALPPGLTVSLVGAQLRFAYFLMQPDYVSNPVAVTITP